MLFRQPSKKDLIKYLELLGSVHFRYDRVDNEYIVTGELKNSLEWKQETYILRRNNAWSVSYEEFAYEPGT